MGDSKYTISPVDRLLITPFPPPPPRLEVRLPTSMYYDWAFRPCLLQIPASHPMHARNIPTV